MKMIRLGSKSIRISVLYLFAVQLLLCSVAISDGIKSTKTPSGAEFLKNVMGNLRKPQTANRKIPNDRIDVEEYIPEDTPNLGQSNEINILSKQPFNYNGLNANANKNQAETLLSQLLNPDFAESQNKIVSQQAPQQFTSLPNNPQTQNLVNVLSSGDPMKQPDGTIGGYNYFFYPLDNNAIKQFQNSNNQQGDNNQQNGQNSATDMMDMNKQENQVTKSKVEPLFVAMAGFVGVAVVFLSALMFIPRLPISALSSKAVLKRAPEELASLTKLVTESIDGKDCSERIACEVGRAMRSMQVGSKPIRMMEIILPPTVAKQLAQIRRAATRKEQCHFISCKNTEGTLKLVAKLKRPNNKTINDVREIFDMH